MSRHHPNLPHRRPLRLALLAAAIGATATLPTAAAVETAKAHIKNRDGETVGNAMLRQMPAGVLLHVKLANLPPGGHAFHIHETGVCEPPFKSAGGHLSMPDGTHGYLNPEGPHLGDMPNIHVPESGSLELEVMTRVTDMSEQLFDDDGSSLVIHQGIDDYRTEPAGEAGKRIACGVIEQTETP